MFIRPIAIVTLLVVFSPSILGCQQRVAEAHPTATRGSKLISQSSVSSPTQTSEPSPTSLSVTTLPMGSSWILGNNPIAIEGEISIGIHVVVITDQHITLVCSVPDNSGSNPNIGDVKLTDDANNAYKILGATSLARIEGLQIGSITFEGPKPGITRLDLFVQSKVGQLMVNIAQADIPNTPPDLIEGMQNLIPREDYLEQEKYRVSLQELHQLRGLPSHPQHFPRITSRRSYPKESRLWAELLFESKIRVPSKHSICT